MDLKLPERVCATYFTLWGGGARITSVPLTYNQIYLFHAVPSGTNGSFRFDYGSAVSAAEIDTCQARGQRVVLTVGGANAGFNFQTRAQSQNFITSFKKMHDQLGGVNGCDFNNFEARIGSSPTEMIWIAQQLKAAYGPDFTITAPPAPGAGWAPMDRTLTAAMAKAGCIDYAGPQFYDSDDLKQELVITGLIDEWVVNMGGDASKVVVGLSANYAGGPALATCQSAWKKIVAKHPRIRGVFAWSAQDDAADGWNWGKTMGPLVGAKPVTDTPTVPPAPPPSGIPTWNSTTAYVMGDKVTLNSKTYQVVNVDANGPKGLTPGVSTYYWKDITVPVVQPPPAPPPIQPPPPPPAPSPEPEFKVGDRVQYIAADALFVGTITSMSGEDGDIAAVKLESLIASTASLEKL